GDEEIITIIKKTSPMALEERAAMEELDWRRVIIADLKRPPEERQLSWKMLKTYTLLDEDLYFITTGGGLCRCLGPNEIKEKLEEIHSQTCDQATSIMLHLRIQRAGFYLPDMAEQAKALQDNCMIFQGAPQESEVCVAEDDLEDWREPYIDYPTNGTLPGDKKAALRLNKKSGRYFVLDRKLFRKSFNQQALTCLDKAEALKVMDLTHDGEHQGKA
ncbi:hypothetical protein MKW92_050913, partial [Papaver armeniacum]